MDYERKDTNRIPRWLTIVGLAVAIVVILVVLMALVGGGGHQAPFDHGAGAGVDPTPSAQLAAGLLGGHVPPGGGHR